MIVIRRRRLVQRYARLKWRMNRAPSFDQATRSRGTTQCRLELCNSAKISITLLIRYKFPDERWCVNSNNRPNWNDMSLQSATFFSVCEYPAIRLLYFTRMREWREIDKNTTVRYSKIFHLGKLPVSAVKRSVDGRKLRQWKPHGGTLLVAVDVSHPFTFALGCISPAPIRLHGQPETSWNSKSYRSIRSENFGLFPTRRCSHGSTQEWLR